MYACQEQHHDLAEVLIKGKADLKIRNKLYWGHTALHMAVLQVN